MAPKISVPTGVLHETDNEVSATEVPVEILKPDDRKFKLVWRSIIWMGCVHPAAIYGCYLMFTSAKFLTGIWAFFLYQIGGLGITAGVHRLWSHKAYKAKWPLALLLIFFNTVAYHNPAIDWARDHRVHHKYSETDADPHNAKRGFFFSHIGWLLCRTHPEVKAKGKSIDMSDLYADPFLKYQKKYYFLVMPICAFLMPTVVPMYFWEETFSNAFFLNLFRYGWTLNAYMLVNSAAHIFGSKPYDKYIHPAENTSVAIVALGEGWHNFHHTFPWDYKASEMGKYSVNTTCLFIDLMAKIGWAYDLKTVSEDMVRKRVKRTGDGTHDVWGWGDKDQTCEEIAGTIITHKRDH